MGTRWLVNRRLPCASLLLALVLIPVWGCKRKEGLSLREQDAAKTCYLLSRKGLSLESTVRANLARRKWENGVVDAEPILIDAMLTTFEGEEKPVMLLAMSDEDEDVLGIVISERYTGSGREAGDSLEEQYTLYTGNAPLGVLYEIIPVTIRSGRERKDNVLWRDYVQAATLDRDKLPPIWVSIPSDDVQVQVSIFDAAGHSSAPVDLYNRIR